MKTQLLLISIFLVFGVGNSFAQYASFPYDQDIIDSKQTMDAFESASGLTFVQDATQGSVLEMDGSNGFITLGSNAYNFAALTYNIWFKWTTPTVNQWWARIFDFGKASDPDPGNHDVMYVTTFAFEDKLRWVIHSMAADGGIDTILMSNAKLELNKWYMLTLVHADSAKLYLNGVLQQAKGIGYTPNQLTFDNCYIGKSNWPDPLFQGRMNDFSIWNSKLSDSEIAALYPAVSAIDNLSANMAQIYLYNNAIIIEFADVTSNSSASLYNIQGALVYSNNSLGSYTEIENLEAGVYILKVRNSDNVSTQKILIR